MAAGYRQALGEAWLACTCRRTLTAKHFKHDLGVARQKLDAVYASAARTAERHEMERATAALNRAEKRRRRV
jgi:hypothetical protein